jgi:hypothetical protein
LRGGSFAASFGRQSCGAAAAAYGTPGDRPLAVLAVSRCRACQHHGQAVRIAPGARVAGSVTVSGPRIVQPGQSGKRKTVAARFVRNDRLADALNAQAFSALNTSPGARAFYDEFRARGLEHNDALRRLANRLVGILHGCLKTRTLYDEATAWGHRENLPQSSVAA